MDTLTARRSQEHAVALIWAILVMIIVGVTIVLVGATTMQTVSETRDNANRTRSSTWAQAAGDDVLSRVRSMEIGATIASTTGSGDRVLSMPMTGLVSPPLQQRYTTPCSSDRARLLTNSNGARAYYQVLPPAAGVGTCWTALQVRNPATPGLQGSIQVVVRVWEDVDQPEPVTVRFTMRQTSITKFSILSNSAIQIGVGASDSITPRGFIHTNNAGLTGTAIEIVGSAAGATRITSTRGAITPSCSVCTANVGDVVEFGAATKAMNQVERLASMTTPVNYAGVGIAQVTGPPPPSPVARQMAMWIVDLVACGTGVGVQPGRVAVRTDLGGIPLIDDRETIATNGVMRCYNIAPVGGALLLDGDAYVRGLRPATSPAVTIMTRRGTAFPNVLIDHDSDTPVPTPDQPSRVSAPASIYMMQIGAGIGSVSSANPVGLVAEGGIYFPEDLMLGANNRITINNVAAMAASGEVALGPSILGIASDGSTPGVGLSPAEARAKHYGFGENLLWRGAIASSRPIYLRYGAGATYLGYNNRDISYVDDLAWNPPPLYPRNRDWYIADSQDFQ